MSQALNKTQNQEEVKYLVIDDEIAANEVYQTDFVADINLPNTTPIFVASCEEAIWAITNQPDICLCFLDYRLPHSIDETRNPVFDETTSSGLTLIPKINALSEKLLIIVFSAYVKKTNLIAQAKTYSNLSNVIGYIEKSESAKVLRDFFLIALQKSGIKLASQRVVDKTSSSKSTFSYDGLSQPTRDLILEKTKLINVTLKRTAQDVVNIGRYISEVKKALPHGQFDNWVDSELGLSKMAASRFVRAYERFKSIDLSEIDIVPTAMYNLATATVSNETFDQIIEEGKSGKSITVEVAKAAQSRTTNNKLDNKSKTLSEKENKSNNILDLPQKAATTIQSQNTTDSKLDNKSKTLSEKENKSNNIFLPQEIVKVIPQQKEWHLGRHRLYCYNPNDRRFIEAIPSEVALVLSFPMDKNWSFDYTGYITSNTFYSQIPDDLAAVKFDYCSDIVQDVTEDGDTVVVCFIPHPKVINLLDKLKCTTYIADPNLENCLTLVNSTKLDGSDKDS